MGTILLVRHGQASFGADDYDVLSPLGQHQAARLGRALAGQGIQPAALTSGALRRQRTSAAVLASQAGWALDASVDPGWDEFDQNRLAAGIADGGQAAPTREGFQAALETGMRAWAAAGDPPGASEPFAAFTTRTEAALRGIATGQPPGATAVIVTSGGVISWLVTALLSGGVEQWIRLNRVCVNTGVTKLVNGRRGISLVSFNEHSHLAGPELTYRLGPGWTVLRQLGTPGASSRSRSTTPPPWTRSSAPRHGSATIRPPSCTRSRSPCTRWPAASSRPSLETCRRILSPVNGGVSCLSPRVMVPGPRRRGRRSPGLRPRCRLPVRGWPH